MALIWYEHFDLYGTGNNASAAWAALMARGYTQGVNNSTNLTATNSRTGAACLSFNATSNAQNISRTLSADTRAMVGCGIALRASGYPTTQIASNASGFRFGTAANANEIAILMGESGIVYCYQGATLRGTTGPNVYPVNAYYWLEAQVVWGTGTATVEVRLNGAPILVFSGLTIAEITRVQLGHNGSNTAANLLFDDWIIYDNTNTVNNTWMGDTFVIVAPPNADSTPNDWTPSSGSNRWDMIDELIPNDADFITATAVGNVNQFTHTAPTLPAGAVAAVAVQVRAFKTDAGASTIEIGASSAGNNEMSSPIALGTGVASYSHILNKDPNGAVPWSQSAAQAAQLRARRNT